MVTSARANGGLVDTALDSGERGGDFYLVMSIGYHIVRDFSLFSQLRRYNGNQRVYSILGDSVGMPILGIGTAVITTPLQDGEQVEIAIENALYVPSFITNVICVPVLLRKGIEMAMDNGRTTLTLSNGAIIDCGPSVNGLLRVPTTVPQMLPESEALGAQGPVILTAEIR